MRFFIVTLLVPVVCRDEECDSYDYEGPRPCSHATATRQYSVPASDAQQARRHIEELLEEWGEDWRIKSVVSES